MAMRDRPLEGAALDASPWFLGVVAIGDATTSLRSMVDVVSMRGDDPLWILLKATTGPEALDLPRFATAVPRLGGRGRPRWIPAP